MAKQVQFRGGTTSEHSSFTGAEREITVDTDKNTVVVHDGSTEGGFPLATKADLDNIDLSSKADINGDATQAFKAKVGVDDDDVATKAQLDTRPTGFKNYIINGGFDIWQRGTSFDGATFTGKKYIADRFSIYNYNTDNGVTWSRVQGELGQYALKSQRAQGNEKETSQWVAAQSIESSSIIPLQGKTVTLSAYIKAGADFSGSSLVFKAVTGTGIDENWVYGYTGQVSFVNNISLTTTLSKYTLTFTIPSDAQELVIECWYGSSGTAGADDSVTIEQIQLELGSVATPFERRHIGLELSLCQRYYEKSYNDDTAIGTATTAGMCYQRDHGDDTGVDFMAVRYKATKRTVPTVTKYSPDDGAIGYSYVYGLEANTSSMEILSSGVSGFSIGTASNITDQGNIVGTHWVADAEL